VDQVRHEGHPGHTQPCHHQQRSPGHHTQRQGQSSSHQFNRVWKQKGLSLKMQNIAKMRQYFDLNVRNSVSAKSSKGLRILKKIKMSMKQFTVSQKLKLVHSYSHNFLWKHMNLRLAHILTKCLIRLTNSWRLLAFCVKLNENTTFSKVRESFLEYLHKYFSFWN
jgi:hypothetical protein